MTWPPMNHGEIDQYSVRSRWYGFDPRVKLVCVIGLVVVTAFMRDLAPLVVIFAFVAALLLLSRVPLRHLGGGIVLALPFIIFPVLAMVITSGPMPALLMTMRIVSSIFALMLLITTTPMFDLLKAMRWFHFPALMSSLLLFTYRFIFVLIDEMERMKMARKARGFTGRGSLLSRDVFKTLSYTAGMVFVRSNARAMNIYNALMARGFTGEVVTLRRFKARPADGAFGAMFVCVSVIAIMLQMGVAF